METRNKTGTLSLEKSIHGEHKKKKSSTAYCNVSYSTRYGMCVCLIIPLGQQTAKSLASINMYLVYKKQVTFRAAIDTPSKRPLAFH